MPQLNPAYFLPRCFYWKSLCSLWQNIFNCNSSIFSSLLLKFSLVLGIAATAFQCSLKTRNFTFTRLPIPFLRWDPFRITAALLCLLTLAKPAVKGRNEGFVILLIFCSLYSTNATFLLIFISDRTLWKRAVSPPVFPSLRLQIFSQFLSLIVKRFNCHAPAQHSIFFSAPFLLKETVFSLAKHF